MQTYLRVLPMMFGKNFKTETITNSDVLKINSEVRSFFFFSFGEHLGFSISRKHN